MLVVGYTGSTGATGPIGAIGPPGDQGVDKTTTAPRGKCCCPPL